MNEPVNEEWRYLTIGPRDEQWGLVCTTVGFQQVLPRGTYPVSKHPTAYNRISSGRVLDEYQMVYIVEGKGVFESASVERTEVTAGTIIMLFPGEWHTYRPDAVTGWSEFWVGFKGESAGMREDTGFFSRRDPLHKVGISETMIGLYRRMIDIAREERPGYQQLMAGIIAHVQGLVQYKVQNSAFADDPLVDKINRARLMMRENINNPISPEEIASQLGLGYTWFRRMFRQYTGVAPAQYASQLRMAKAKELLVSSPVPVSEIAYELGFESISQFSTFFKKKEGLTPSQFRAKNTFARRSAKAE